MPRPTRACWPRIWAEVLGVGHVGPDDDFFSLGGDSLLAVQVIGAANERGLRLTLLDLFKNPTPRGACAGAAPAARRRRRARATRCCPRRTRPWSPRAPRPSIPRPASSSA
ncbi:acyl carrier protein [Streptomyces stramineus]